MTNYEKIKNMTVEELARFLCFNKEPCKRCAFHSNPCLCSDAVDVHRKWLESEVKE